MSTSDILNFIRETLLDRQRSEPLQEDDDILTTGLLDSIALMHLIVFIENQAKLKIPVEDVTIEHFRTAGKIVAYLEKLKTQQDTNRPLVGRE